MSILIPGMEMPDYGYVCLKVFANGEVLMTKKRRGSLVITGIREKVGTAVPLHDHGRLIDADDFFRTFPELIPYEFATQTIIPADKEETNG